MKYIIRILFISFTFSIVCYGYAQPLIVTKTVILRHETQTDTLRIPIVSDKYPALKKALSYKNLFDGDDLPAVIKNYASCGCGITGLNYQVTFQNKGILSVILYFESMGAYPDDYQKYLTFNINTGQIYPVTNEINTKGLNWIFNTYKAELKKKILDSKDDKDEQSKDAYNELMTAVDSLNKDELLGKYVFTKAGVLFSIEKILPHVIQSFEPDRDWLIPYDKLKIYKTPAAVVLK